LNGSPRVEALTFLRFLAAMGVVLFHFGGSAEIAVGPGVGPMMVTFFFVLSGFVLAITYLPRAQFDARRFFFNRLSRIAPVYYVGVLSMVALYWGLAHRLPDHVALGLNLAFVQSLVPGYPNTVNPPGWSLSVEVMLYLSFPLLVKCFREMGGRRALALAAALWLLTQVALSALLYRTDYAADPLVRDVAMYSPFAHWCSFVLGVAGGRWFLQEGSGKAGRGIATLLFWTSLAMVLQVLTHFERWRWLGSIPVSADSAFSPPLFLLVVLSVALAGEGLARALSLRAFVVLGNASYSVYILQTPVAVAYRQLLLHGEIATLPQLLGLLAVLVAVSIGAYYLFERPLMLRLRAAWQGGGAGNKKPAT